MPTYSYRCPRCGHEYRKLQKITDEVPVPCPECDAPGERLITGGGGLVFKGSGFYVTDYKRAGEKKEKEKEETKQTSEKSESKGDTGTKPAKSSGAES